MHLISAQTEKQIKDSDSEDTNQLSASMYDMDFSQFIGSTRKKKKENLIKIDINYTIQAFKASTFL